MQVLIKSEQINNYLVEIRESANFDNESYTIVLMKMITVDQATKVKEKTVWDKKSAYSTFNYYKRCAKTGKC